MTSSPLPSPAAPVIEVRDLSFAYPGSPPGDYALQNVSLTVRKGDFLAVVGPNGGGKTTLLLLLLGLFAPNAGSVCVFGGQPAHAASRIGFVPQFSTARTDFPATVLDVALMGYAGTRPGGLHGLFVRYWRKTREMRERAYALLEQLGLSGLEKRSFGGLSGGQRQRALLARALMADPELLLLDEPTSSIDPYSSFCFFEFLASLHERHTIVVVSHDLAVTAVPFTSLAFVNRALEHSQDTGVTPERIAALYGTHEPGCPLSPFADQLMLRLNEIAARASSEESPKECANA